MVERHARFLRNRLRFQLELDPEEDAIQLVVRHPELSFVGLTGPQAGGRHLLDDLRWESEITGHLPHLRLVQIPDREEVRGAISMEGKVAAEQLALVPRAHDDAPFRVRDEVQDDHAGAGPEVPAGDLVRLESQQPFFQGRHDRRNPDDPKINPERLGELLRVLEVLPAPPVGHRDAEHMLRAERVRAQLRDEGRIDPAAEPEDDALPTALAERVDEERLNDEDLLLLESGDQLGHGERNLWRRHKTLRREAFIARGLFAARP